MYLPFILPIYVGKHPQIRGFDCDMFSASLQAVNLKSSEILDHSNVQVRMNVGCRSVIVIISSSAH